MNEKNPIMRGFFIEPGLFKKSFKECLINKHLNVKFNVFFTQNKNYHVFKHA